MREMLKICSKKLRKEYDDSQKKPVEPLSCRGNSRYKKYLADIKEKQIL
jgi:hypothetical protein